LEVGEPTRPTARPRFASGDDLASFDPAGELDLPIEQDPEGVGGRRLGKQERAGRDRNHLGMVDDPADLLVGALFEEERRLQLGGQGLVRHGAPTSARYWWIKETAIDPSPTPEATRLIEPWRTSPATKMPGALVSRRNGSRSSGQPGGRWPSPGR